MKNELKDIIKELSRIGNALETLHVLYGLDRVPEQVAATVADDKPVVKKATKKKAEPEPTQYTHDDLKAACLACVRDDVSNKSKLKALLAEYGANKAADVAADKLEEIIGKITAGEY